MMFRFALVLFLLTSNIYSQEVIFKVKIDSQKVAVATQFEITLEAVTSESISVQFPKYEQLSNEFEILNQGKVLRIVENKNIKFTKKLTLINFKLDSLTVPPFRISYSKSGDSTKYFTVTDSLKLIVIPPTLDSAATYRDIKPPIEVPLKWKDIAEYSLYVLVAIILCLLVYYLFNRKKKIIIVEEEKIILPPEVIALQQLEELEKEKLIEKNEVKLFYSRISDLLKIYFESRFSFLAVEQTTNEILYELKVKIPDKELYSAIKELLQTSDLVKFAKLIPANYESDTIIPKTRLIINKTTSKISEEVKNVE